ncbi:hypothetical protein D9M68_151390 [compost metagenome]
MKSQRSKLLITAVLAVLTNAFALLGIGQGSAGAVARTIECTHTLSRNLQAAEALKRLPGDPPKRTPSRPAVAAFSLDGHICAGR